MLEVNCIALVLLSVNKVVHPLIHSFTFCGFSYPPLNVVWKQMILLTNRQEVNSRLMLRYDSYVITLPPSFRAGILPSLSF